jgi:hypothetical protein
MLIIFQNLVVNVALLGGFATGCVVAMKPMSDLLMKHCSYSSLSYFSTTNGVSTLFAFTCDCIISQLLCAPMSHAESR